MIVVPSDVRILGVIGNPVKHSLSPLIHNFIYDRYSINAIYLPIEAKLGYFEKVLDGLCFLENSVGFNVTVPFKERALKSMDHLSREADAIGAVNVIKRGEDKLIGFNTDWIGFVESLKVNGVGDIESALVVGAGGAGKAVIYGLISIGVPRIFVTNRDKVKLGMVVERFGDSICAVDWDRVDEVIGNIDLIVNATSVGLDGVSELPFDLSRLKKSAVVYDTIYNPPLTPLLKKAKELGLRFINGLDMLVLQALYSVEIWFGLLPDFEEVKSFLLNNNIGGSL